MIPSGGPLISVVIPVYNEEENITFLHERLVKVLSQYESYEIVLVDDGSNDTSLQKIQALNSADPHVRYIAFSRNFGHQSALRAGLDKATGRAVIMMDSDLQHPPELIPSLVGLWQEGSQVVNTIRANSNIPLLKRITSGLFYRFINAISDIAIEPHAADFRLLDRKVVDTLKRLPESGFFLRGLTSWVGFKQAAISYEPAARFSGRSKYSWTKMLTLAWDGITSLSVMPLRISVWVGFSLFVLSLVYAAYIVWTIFTNPSYLVPGWTSVMFCILFVGGFQLIMFGLIGEYISRMARDVKNRPHYIIADEG